MMSKISNHILVVDDDDKIRDLLKDFLIKLSITKQSLNRVLKILLEKKMVIQEINKKDKRMKNLYLSDDSKKIINNLIGPTIKEISNAFQKSGSEAVNGFNQIFLNLAEKK